MIGVDVGGTRIRAVVVDESLAVCDQVVRETPRTCADLPAAIVSCVQALQVGEISAVGVVTPGSIDPARGAVSRALNLGIGEEPLLLGPAISAAGGWPVVLGNDVDAAAVAAHRMLGLDDDLPSVLLSVGTGIAAGVVVGGAALTGARRTVGEIGHLPLASRRARCRCGATRCLEAVASGSAISRTWPRTLDGSTARSLLTDGSRRAHRTRQRVLDALAAAVEMLDALVDPQCIVLGGGVSEVGEVLLAALQQRMRERGAGRLLAREATVVLAPSPRVLGAVGAALTTSTLLVT